MTQFTVSFSSIKLIRRCGRVLIGVFVLVVTTNIFPLNLRSPDWGLGLSNNIVNSASLALVGVGLLRYSAFLELQALTETDANPQIFYGTPGKQESSDRFKSKALAKLNKTEFGIRRLALAVAISLLLLATWQAILYFNGIDVITAQSLSASTSYNKQIEEVEQRIQGAPDQVIDAEWKKFQATSARTFFTVEPDTAAKRKQLLTDFKAKNQQARLGIEQQVSGASWNLARNALRVFLMAMTYAWGFYGLHKL